MVAVEVQIPKSYERLIYDVMDVNDQDDLSEWLVTSSYNWFSFENDQMEKPSVLVDVPRSAYERAKRRARTEREIGRGTDWKDLLHEEMETQYQYPVRMPESVPE